MPEIEELQSSLSLLDIEYTKKETTGQTVYEQLQEILNKCMDLGWKPRGEGKWGYEKLSCDEDGMYISYGVCISYHDLFSKDSGIMEFVEWKNMDKHTAYIVMSDMTAEQKIQYFLDNAIIPTT